MTEAFSAHSPENASRMNPGRGGVPGDLGLMGCAGGWSRVISGRNWGVGEELGSGREAGQGRLRGWVS
jgi:hypothetical protein